jgi:hypothetical protein
MISLKIVDIKAFMSSLLIQNTFDNFMLSELDIITYNHFHVSGTLNEEFYTSEELETLNGRKYSTWGEIKQYAYSLIRGHKLPLSIKIVFLLSPANQENVLQKSGTGWSSSDINGLFLNIRFEKGNAVIITGISMKTFTMDKSLERSWDENVKAFLKHFDIAVEEA